MFYNLVSAITKFVAIVFAIIFLLFGILAVVECVKYKDYVTFEADVINAYNAPSSGESSNRYVDISYTYNGVTYTTSQQVLTQYSSGDKIKIRINPDDPTELAGNVLLFVFVILAGTFGFIALVLGIVSSFIKKLKTA